MSRLKSKHTNRINYMKKKVVYNTLLDNLEAIEYRKKTRGEVFTEMTIVRDQLSRLPSYIWKDKSMKWLDVASGMGNYAIHCYYELMIHLSSHIKNVRKRSKHIIEKMLYMIEIDDDNVKKCRDLFHIIDSKAEPNILHADFLEHDFKGDLFDIIIGNPPYAKPNKKNRERVSTRSLYPDIVSKSLDILKDEGYLSFIHPVSWRRYSRESRFSFDKYDLLFMYTHNNFQGFGISAPYINYYVLRKTNTPKLKTDCVTVYDDRTYRSFVCIKNRPFLPLLLNNVTLRILKKLMMTHQNTKNTETSIPVDIKIISSNSTTKKSINAKKTREFPHKNVHNYSIHKDTYLYRYSKKKHKSHDLSKIVMIYKGGYKYFKPLYNEGCIGVTDNAMFMPVDEDHKDTFLKFFESDLVQFVLRTCNYNYGRNMKNEYKILNMMRIPLSTTSASASVSLHRRFGLTPSESRFIRKIVF